MRVLVKNAAWLITVDRERRIFDNGALAIVDDRIVDVGPTRDIVARFTADVTIDAEGRLVLPGLIDTHVHNVRQLGRGLADECDVPMYLFQRVFPYEASLTPDDAYWAARACQLELIRAGTTCFVDSGSFFPEDIARALGETGMRGVIARAAFDLYETPLGRFPEESKEGMDSAVQHAEDIVQRLNGAYDGRLRAWFALPMMLGASDMLLREIVRLAEVHGVGVVLHAARSRNERAAAQARFGVSEVERLAFLGALRSRMLLIHMGWATPRELVLVRDHDAKVSCSPSAGYRLGLGSIEFGRFPEMLELGVTVALGSGSAMSSNFLDIVRQLFLMAGGCKSDRLDQAVMSAEAVVEMATINGARAALWADDIGSLQVGKQADVAIFDTRESDWRPVLNPVANLVYCGRGGADTVIINGKIVMERGVITTTDETATLEECQRRAEAIAARSGLARFAQTRWPVI